MMLRSPRKLQTIVNFKERRLNKKLESLRLEMKKRGIQAYILTGSDSHLSEYVSDYWKTLEWLSGFTGSAGTIVVTEEKALLWTDFRYWIQAAQEIDKQNFTLIKDGKEDAPTIPGWLLSSLNSGDVAAVNGWTLSVEMGSRWANELSQGGISLEDCGDLSDNIWKNRPFETADPIIDHPLEFTGESRDSKLEKLRKKMKDCRIASYFLSSLDDIAWLLNLRGTDISFNPVFRSYLLIREERVLFFLDKERLESGLVESLEKSGIVCYPYESVENHLAGSPESSLLLHPVKTPWIILHFLNPERKLKFQPDLVPALKSVKNTVELDGFRKAMVLDGVQIIRLQIWLRKKIQRGESLKELDVSRKISSLRAEVPDCVDDSFAPIPAYAENGALCHYEASEQRPVTLSDHGLFLLDSGGQYRFGTTDITRTFSMGQVSPEMIKDYTLVLKGHVALSCLEFPKGSKGFQLDTVARYPLWKEGLDYGHGTGHGVGSYLNVHEGPQSISPRPIDVPLKCGMVISNEPGIYREGKWGIRIENLVLVEKRHSSDMGEFYGFETLTLAPYERELIDKDRLSSKEKEWIDNYHQRVFSTISPLLKEEEKEWLMLRCEAL